MFFEKRTVPIRASSSGGHASLSVGSGNWLSNSSGYISADQAIRNSDVWTAVNIISSDIARTYYHSDNKATDKVLQSPSNLTNRFSFYQAMAAQMLLAGNAYALRRCDVDGKGEWWEFIPPSNVTVWLSEDGQSLSYNVIFQNPSEGTLENVDASDMIHWRWLSTNGGMTGRSPLTSLVTELEMQGSASNLSLATLKQAVTPTSILSTDVRLKPAEREEARTAFEAANTGTNAGRVLVMDNLFKYSSVQVNADIAKILASTDYTRDQIAKAFMLPATLLGNEASHSNIDQIRAEYNQTFGRYLSAVVEELENKLKGNIATDIHLINDLDGTVLESRLIALAGAGLVTPAMSQQILADSPSDILNEDNLARFNLQEALSKTETVAKSDTMPEKVAKTEATEVKNEYAGS